MSPEFIKTALRDMHRFGFDGMLQGYGGNLKHLHNRSPSSLHGKLHKLTRRQLVVLHLCNASLGQHKKWIRMWMICASCHLTNHDCAKIWLQKPGLRGLRIRGSVLLQANCKQCFIIFRFGAMKPVRPSRIRCCPSGRYEDCFKPKALPVPDSTLQLCGSASTLGWPHLVLIPFCG